MVTDAVRVLLKGTVLRLKGGASDAPVGSVALPTARVGGARRPCTTAQLLAQKKKHKSAAKHAKRAAADAEAKVGEQEKAIQHLQTKLAASEAVNKRASVPAPGGTASDGLCTVPDSVSAPRLAKSAEPRRPAPFAGEGKQNQAGEVRRFVHQMELYFQLARIPEDHVTYAMLNLQSVAVDHVHTFMQTVAASQQADWSVFVACLNARFGRIDPDAEFWDQLRDLRQGTFTAATKCSIVSMAYLPCLCLLVKR